MESCRRMAAVVFGVGVMLTGLPAPSLAELIRVEITSRVDVLNGKAFGAVGPYEKIWGRPTSRSTRRIRAIRSSPISTWPRGTATGRSSSRPISSFSNPRTPRAATASSSSTSSTAEDSACSARSATHRAPTTRQTKRTSATPRCSFRASRSSRSAGSSTCPRTLIGLDAPIPTNNGQPIKGWVREWFILDKPADSFNWTGGNATKGISRSTSTPPTTG